MFYIDADCLIQGNPEDVFTRDTEFAAAPDIFPPDRFNAGVLLIVRNILFIDQKPNMELFNDMLSKSTSI